MAPKVWTAFEINRKDGAVTRIRIQDLTKELVDNTADFYAKFFYRDEAFSIAAGVSRNPHAVAEARSLVLDMMNNPAFSFIICCENEGGDDVDKIIGVAILELIKSSETQKNQKMKTKEMQTYTDLSQSFCAISKATKKLKVPCYCEGRHIIISHEYRTFGIARELLRVCCIKAREQGFSVIGAPLTSLLTQEAAARIHWETIMEVDFLEFGRQNDVTFHNVPPTIKYMICQLSDVQF